MVRGHQIVLQRKCCKRRPRIALRWKSRQSPRASYHEAGWSLDSLGDQDDIPSPHKQLKGSISPTSNEPDARVVDGKALRDDCANTSPEDIELQDVSFKYDNSRHSPLIIDKATFRLPAGKLTALVGGSGSGKTTIMKMLLKFYDPSMGKITIGNTDLSKISPEAWRSRCGVVMQEG